MGRKFTWFVLVWLVCGGAWAQDPQLSQYYAAPLYHNPAFTGSGYAPRIILNYRNQWPSLDANYVTSMISFDHYFDKINSGVGVLAMNDIQGTTRLATTEISLFYSYQMNVVDDNFIRFGIQGTYRSRGLNLNGLTFPDQFNNTGYIGPSSDPILSQYTNSKYSAIDFTPGILFYNPKVFLGVAAHHIGVPASNFLMGVKPNIIINGGVNLSLANPSGRTANMGKEFVITPTFLFKRQGKFTQLDLGAYATYSPMTIGLWYRGIPFLTNGTKTINHDALILLVGFRFESFSFGYSYDLTISNLGLNSGGSHEISLAYQFSAYKSEKNPYIKRRKKALACPKF